MSNASKITWITIAIVVGFFFVLTSISKNGAGRHWEPRLAAFGFRGLDDSSSVLSARSPRSNQAERARSRLYRGTLGGLGTTTNSERVGTVETKPQIAPSAPASTKPQVTKAEDKKKKKKSKKKKSALPDGGELANSTHSENSDRGQSDTAKSGLGPLNTANAPTVGSTSDTSQNDNPKTLDEWLVYILREPSYERTMKLISGHQVREVSGTIFYAVIDEMLADPRGKMHEYAVLALGSTPSLNSFILLHRAIAAESAGSPIRLQARNSMGAYTKLEFLKYLVSAVTSFEVSADAKFEALKLIRTSAEQNLRLGTSTPPSGAGSGPTSPGTTDGHGTSPTSTATASSRKHFTPLLPILSRVIQTAEDQSIRNEATLALQRIQSLLGTSVAAN